MPQFIYGSGEYDPSLRVVKLPRPLQDYMDNAQPSGTRNAALLNAAIQARDLRWSETETVDRLLHLAHNRDGLPEAEASRTIRSAYSHSPRDPAGRVPHGTLPPVTRTALVVKKEPKLVEYALDPGFEMPTPIVNGAVEIIKAMFAPSERIMLCRATMDGDDGERLEKETISREDQKVFAREVLLEILENPAKCNGNPMRIFGRDNHGIFFCINPIGKESDRRRADNIADCRYGLIEFDKRPDGTVLSKEEQMQVILKSKIPCRAIVDSGRISIHAYVHVAAGTNLSLYKSRMQAYLDHFAKYSPDPQVKDPSRFSRLPEAIREDSGGQQKLLAVDVGCKSYEEWEREIIVEEDGIPALRDAVEMTREVDEGKLLAPEEIVQGIGHRGLKMVVGGASKARKTWCLIDLAVSVASGTKWMSELQCNPGTVLFLNMELPEYFMAARIKSVCAAKGVELKPKSLLVLNLRGFADHLLHLRPKLEKLVEGMNLSMIVLDPKYKLMPGSDEIGTSDTSALLNEMDKLAVKCNALCVFADHFSKGNQAAKKAQDRISGTGITSRDGDAIVTMTEHAEDMALSVDFVLRNHPPMNSFVIKWEHPLFVVDYELDPTKLAEAPDPKRKPKEEPPILITPGRLEKLKLHVAENPMGQNQLLVKIREIFEIKSPKRAKIELLPVLIEKGYLTEADSDKKSGPHPTKIYTFHEKIVSKTESENHEEF